MTAWTNERVDLLRTLHADGKTRTEMAEALGFADRGAVCGKLNRMGLTGKGPRAIAANVPRRLLRKNPHLQPNGTTSDWTDELVLRLIELWPDWTISAAQIAQELGIGSRSSVSNRASRLIREGRLEPRTRVMTKTRNNAFAYQVKSKTPIAPTLPASDPEPATPFRQRCSLMELTNKTCKWPIGDPAHEDFFFCGGKPIDGLPYCVHHARVAYQPRKQPNGPTDSR